MKYAERQFRLFSIACLGLAALACMSESPRAEMAIQAPATEVVVTQDAIENEVEDLQLIEQINSGRFKPYELGSLESYQ